MFIRQLAEWILELTGSKSSASMAYNFWSGFGGDLTVIVALLAYPYVTFKKHNCHAKKCLRIGHYDFKDDIGIVFKLCRKHHPDHPGQVLTAEQITQRVS